METAFFDAVNAAVRPGCCVRILRTGEIGRVRSVDSEWADLFPHKGPLLILDVEGGRQCYSLCELEPLREEVRVEAVIEARH